MKACALFRLLAPVLGLACLRAPAEPPVQAAETADCRVIQTAAAVFPERLQNAGVTHGEARVMLQVDTAGRLTDTLVTAYTHEAFAREAERVLRQWRFEPGRVGGEPVGSVFEMAFFFRIDGMSVRVRHGGGQAEQDLPAGQYAFQASPLGQLDRAPVPISASAPRYPGAWAHRGVRGRVTVEFYIDQEGRVRMPAVVSGDSRLLGGAAVATIQQWRFSPPTRAGVPALVLAQQEFVFGAERALPPVRPQAPGRP